MSVGALIKENMSYDEWLAATWDLANALPREVLMKECGDWYDNKVATDIDCYVGNKTQKVTTGAGGQVRVKPAPELYLKSPILCGVKWDSLGEEDKLRAFKCWWDVGLPHPFRETCNIFGMDQMEPPTPDREQAMVMKQDEYSYMAVKKGLITGEDYAIMQGPSGNRAGHAEQDAKPDGTIH